jgi:hypothetical protein
MRSAALILLLMTNTAFAREINPKLRVEVADRFAICAAYFQIVAHCITQPGDPEESKPVAENYKKSAEIFMQTAGSVVLPKTAMAKFALFGDSMMDEIENSCTNISVLAVQHMKPCKQLQQDPEPIFEDLFRRYGNQ